MNSRLFIQIVYHVQGSIYLLCGGDRCSARPRSAPASNVIFFLIQTNSATVRQIFYIPRGRADSAALRHTRRSPGLTLQYTNTGDRVFFSRRPEAPPGRQASRTASVCVWPWRGLGKPPSLPPAFLFLGVSSGPAYVLHSRYVISGSWTIGYGCSVHLLKYVPIII